MTCELFVQRLDRFLEGSLSPSRSWRMAAHLSVCTHCRTYLDSYQRAIELARAALIKESEHPLPDSLVESILDRLNADDL